MFSSVAFTFLLSLYSRHVQNELLTHAISCCLLSVAEQWDGSKIIAKFSRDFSKWQTFYESFTFVIHSKSNISTVQKFNYLVGKAKKTVKWFNITNEDYQKTLDLLCKRNRNTQVIITIHMNKLLKNKYVKSDKDMADLRLLYDTLEVQIRSLPFLSDNGQSYATLSYYYRTVVWFSEGN